MTDDSWNSRIARHDTPAFDALCPLIDAGYEPIRLHHPAASDKNGRSRGKAPLKKGWRSEPAMTTEEASEHMAAGSNVGIRLRASDLVVDVDPRNFDDGDDPVARLQADLGIRLDAWPTVHTGAGGTHHYMRLTKPASLRDTVEDYAGIEFKSAGRQMVAPGSVHPETGSRYTIDVLDDFSSVPDAPSALVDLIKRPEPTSTAEPGEVSPELLEEMLSVLDVEDYRDHDKWLQLMMSAHHATGGEGREEFIAWSTSDPTHADQGAIIGRRWDSLSSGGDGSKVTQKTLFKAMIAANRGDLVDERHRSDPVEDFASLDPLDEPVLPGAISRTKAKRQANALKARKAKAEIGELRKLKAAESQEAYAAWLNKTFVYDRSNGKRVNVETGEALDDPIFENENGPGWARSGGKGSLVNAIKTGKAGIDMRSVMMAASFPGQKRFVEIDMGTHRDYALNTWYDTTLPPVEGNHVWFKAEVERLFPGDERQQAILFDYWAARCLDPGRKVRWQLVIESIQGAGKGSMKSGFETLFGWRNTGTFGVTQMRDKFNAWMVSAANLFGEEIGFGTWKDAKEAYEHMKAPISDDFIAVRPMQRESQVRVPNGTNYIVNRNRSRFFYCSEDDRRICYLRPNPDDLGEKGSYFEALNGHYRSRADMAAVRHWLINEWAKGREVWEAGGERLAGVGLVRFDDDPPMTDAKRALMRECLKAEGGEAVDFVELDAALKGMDLFTAEDALKKVRDDRLDHFDATDDQLLDAIRKWMRAAGFKKHTRDTNRGALQLYSPPGDVEWSAKGPAERERAYLARA